MTRLLLALASLPVLLAGCAQTVAERQAADQRAADTSAKLATVLARYNRGDTSTCIPLTVPDLHTSTYGPTILYTNGNRLYRTDTAGGCEGAARGDILVSVQHQGRPCSGDIVQTVDQASRMPTGSCALGEFTTYMKR